MKISIIITAYNEERYLAECIESLLSQSHQDMEIIIVDNGSTDDTLKVAKIFEKLRPNTVFVYHLDENENPGGGRNYGATKAKGEILVFVDADMVFDEHYIENLINPIQGDVIGTFHGVEKVKNIKNIWARCWSIDRQPNPPKKSHVFRAILKSKFVEGKGFKTDKGCFDDDLGHIGESVIAKDAICYHNNPETLKEAFKHCIWVGDSFAMNKEYVWSFLKRKWIYLLLCLFVNIFCFASIIYYTSLLTALLFLFITIVVTYLGIIFIATMRRIWSEKYWQYVYSLPILLTIQFFGYSFGFARGLVVNYL